MLIADVPGYTVSRQWDKYANQQSSPITLTAGTPYYIMALQKEGGNAGDNLAVAWSGPGIARQVIDGAHLAPYPANWGPVFAETRLYGTGALEGYGYQDTVAGSASAFDGGAVSYAKASGPFWLQVAADGTLSGIPGDGDIGYNIFDIQATDAEGYHSTVPLHINIENTFTGERGLHDFAELAGRWMSADCQDTPPCNGADLTGDGNVEMADLVAMAGMWLIENPYGTRVANWSFDADASDAVGGHDGTLMNGASITQTNGEFIIGTGGLSLDGVDDYVAISGYQGITGSTSRTCSAWVKTDSSGPLK